MENQEYKLHTVEEYLQLSSIKHLSDEVKEEIRRVRTEYEYMSPEQFTFLKEQGVIERTRKLKGNKRSLWVCENGKIWYFCKYHNRYNYCGLFKSEDE